MLTEQDIQKQRQLNLLDGDLPAIQCLNLHYWGDLSDLLWDLHYWGKLPEAERAFNSQDTSKFTVVNNDTLDWRIKCTQEKLNKLNDDIDEELNGIINCLEGDNQDLVQVIGYLKSLRKSNEKAFNEIDILAGRIKLLISTFS